MHRKIKRSAKCTNSRCRKIIGVGIECVSVEGALTVPYNSFKAVNQKFYFCLNLSCISNRPPWTNIRDIVELTFDKDISDTRKEEISTFLHL